MQDSNLLDSLRGIWDRAVAAWQSGKRNPEQMFSDEDALVLQSEGCTRQEMFDFVDDNQRYGGDPSFETAAAVTIIRKTYFHEIMKGEATGHIVPMSELPAKSEAVDGIKWLPRLIVKARVKLRGEMPDDLMYGCAGDRPFLRDHSWTLPDFLQLVWDAGDDDRRIIDTFKKRAGLS